VIRDGLVPWLTAQPTSPAPDRSRRLLAISALVSLVPVWSVAGQLVDPQALHVPRVPWWTMSVWSTTVIGIVWFISAMTLLLSNSVLASFGLATSVSLAVLGDRQISGNYLVILVITAIAHGCRTLLGRDPSLIGVSDSPLRLIYMLGPVVMAWSAVAKLNPVFLSGAVLEAALSNGLVTIPVTLSPGVFRSLATLVVIGEVALVGTFLLPGLRRVACLAAVAFHSATILLMAVPIRLLAFAFAMATSYVLIWASWLPSGEG
jgi:hypothetical protein